jgi:ATP-binding cassette subfamily C (CFTR/MRP) protein 1
MIGHLLANRTRFERCYHLYLTTIFQRKSPLCQSVFIWLSSHQIIIQIIRMPLLMLPFVLAGLSDGAVSLRRISKFLTAEELAEPYTIDYERKFAVDVEGDFTWEIASKPVEGGQESGHSVKVQDEKIAQTIKPNKGGIFRGKGRKAPALPMTAEGGRSDDANEKDVDNRADEKPFELNNLKLKVPKGAFVAIVGRVGSGKVISIVQS